MKTGQLELLLVIIGVIALAGYKHFTKNPITQFTIIYYAIAFFMIIIIYFLIFLIIRKIIEYRKMKEAEEQKIQREIRKERQEQKEKEEIQHAIKELQDSYQKTKPFLSMKPSKEKLKILEKCFNNIFKAKNLIQDEYIEEQQKIADKIFEEITKTKQILEGQQKAKEKKLDLEKGIYKEKELDKKQIKILEKQGYIRSRHVALGETSSTIYYLKPRAHESTIHFFMTMNIKQYLESKGIKVSTPISRDADIIFTANKKTWAIEVETGSVKKKNPEIFQQKIEKLNKKYGENWFMVLTDKKMIQHYRAERYNIVKKKKIIQKINKIIGPPK